MSAGQTLVQSATMRLLLNAGRAVAIVGPADITEETTDAIVNAANSSLLGGGGVDGAIHDSGGPAILEECRKIAKQIGGRLPAGQAVITTGGWLASKYVIHTVGPVFQHGKEGQAEVLTSCYRECLRIADGHQLHSISFPSISTGAFGYPISEAAPVAISAVLDALTAAQTVELCRLVLFDIHAVRVYERAAERLSQNSSLFRIEKVSS